MTYEQANKETIELQNLDGALINSCKHMHTGLQRRNKTRVQLTDKENEKTEIFGNYAAISWKEICSPFTQINSIYNIKGQTGCIWLLAILGSEKVLSANFQQGQINARENGSKEKRIICPTWQFFMDLLVFSMFFLTSMFSQNLCCFKLLFKILFLVLVTVVFY